MAEQIAAPLPPVSGSGLVVRGAVAVFTVYVIFLAAVAASRAFGWGLLPTVLDRKLHRDVQTLEGLRIPDGDYFAARGRLLDTDAFNDLASYHEISVPILLSALDGATPEAQLPVVLCLVEIGARYFGLPPQTALSEFGADPTAWRDWWVGVQAALNRRTL